MPTGVPLPTRPVFLDVARRGPRVGNVTTAETRKTQRNGLDCFGCGRRPR
jgi:hypothetical protein